MYSPIVSIEDNGGNHDEENNKGNDNNKASVGDVVRTGFCISDILHPFFCKSQ